MPKTLADEQTVMPCLGRGFGMTPGTFPNGRLLEILGWDLSAVRKAAFASEAAGPGAGARPMLPRRSGA